MRSVYPAVSAASFSRPIESAAQTGSISNGTRKAYWTVTARLLIGLATLSTTLGCDNNSKPAKKIDLKVAPAPVAKPY